jgi:REP element-mobilizing transposase RayT
LLAQELKNLRTMPRKHVPASSLHHYHITARYNNRENFPTHPRKTWDIFESYLHFTYSHFAVRTLSFVMMPNHFHWIARFPNGNLGAAMLYFMRETARAISRDSGRINHSYGGAHHKSLINSDLYLMHAYKYVYQNPLRAGFSRRAEEYRFSTLHMMTDPANSLISILDDCLLTDPDQLSSTL